jgi:hypothetical protein
MLVGAWSRVKVKFAFASLAKLLNLGVVIESTMLLIGTGTAFRIRLHAFAW